MPDEALRTKHSMWLAIGRQALAFVGGIILAAFILGGRQQKINDLVNWKDKTAPLIDRMDSQGSLSFHHFHEEYLRTQARQEKMIGELDSRLRDLERK
jgi:hypothetical protein